MSSHTKQTTKLLTVVTRLTILGVCAMMASQIWFIIWSVILAFFGGKHEFEYKIAYISRDIGLMIQCITIYLNLNANINLYHKFCNVVHMTVYKMFLNSATRTIKLEATKANTGLELTDYVLLESWILSNIFCLYFVNYLESFWKFHDVSRARIHCR